MFKISTHTQVYFETSVISVGEKSSGKKTFKFLSEKKSFVMGAVLNQTLQKCKINFLISQIVGILKFTASQQLKFLQKIS